MCGCCACQKTPTEPIPLGSTSAADSDAVVSDVASSDEAVDYSDMPLFDRIRYFNFANITQPENYEPHEYEMSLEQAKLYLQDAFPAFCERIFGITDASITVNAGCEVWEYDGMHLFAAAPTIEISGTEMISDFLFDAQTGMIYSAMLYIKKADTFVKKEAESILYSYEEYLGVNMTGRKYDSDTGMITCHARFDESNTVTAQYYVIDGTALAVSVCRGNLPTEEYLMPGSKSICIGEATQSQSENLKLGKTDAQKALQKELKALVNEGLVPSDLQNTAYDYVGLYMTEFTDESKITFHHIFEAKSEGITVHIDAESGKAVYVRIKNTSVSDVIKANADYAQYLNLPQNAEYRMYSDEGFTAYYRKTSKGRYIAVVNSSDEMLVYLASRTLDMEG